jgi:cellulose biosynthesis protein BcsQ
MTDTTETRGRVVALASGKGGVGKSTLALALADVWAAAGHRVALVDFDAQAGVTRAAGAAVPSWDNGPPGPVEVHGLTLWPAGRALAGLAPDALAERLAHARAAAELVVVDLSPALTDAAHAVTLEAADVLAVVARCDAAGLPNVAETVALANAARVRCRVVPTFRGGTGLAREAEAFLRGRYGDAVTAATIPTDAKAAEAPGRGLPVTRSARRAKVSEAVRELAAELVGDA